MNCKHSWCLNPVISEGLCEAHKEIEALHRGLELQSCEGATMRKNLAALTVFISDGSHDLNKFAKQFPRTWNAIVTDKPTSFDLPEPVLEGREPK